MLFREFVSNCMSNVLNALDLHIMVHRSHCATIQIYYFFGIY